MMNEKSIKAQIQIALSKDPSVRLFNQPSGMAWMGEVVDRSGRLLTIADARPVAFGLCPGSSDLIGWRSIEITPEMVGKRLAQFVAIEVKTPKGRATDEQKRFTETVSRAGGAAGVARSPAEAWGILAEGSLKAADGGGDDAHD